MNLTQLALYPGGADLPLQTGAPDQQLTEEEATAREEFDNTFGVGDFFGFDPE